MKLVPLLVLIVAVGFAQRVVSPEAEQQELNQALSDAGSSPVDFIRALENHLAKYPNSARRGEIERALVKSAIDAKDDKRIIQYGERVLAVESTDLQVLDRVARALLSSDDKASSEKALDYAQRYEKAIRDMQKQPVPGRYGPGQWQDELDRGIARSLALEARATGNLGKIDEAIKLAKSSYDAYPTAEGAREIGRWMSRKGEALEAVEHIADAFTIEDPKSTEADRARDRARMGELYQKAKGTEAGLGDLILRAYDRTTALMSERISRLKARDPNAQAVSIMDYTLPGPNGDKLALASLKGKTVVLDFWATWCGPCRAQHSLYQKVEEHFRGKQDVVFIYINTDEDHALVAPFLKSQHWNGKVYFESGLSRMLQITSIPTTIVVDRSGQVSSRMAGYVPERFVDMLTDRIQQTLSN